MNHRTRSRSLLIKGLLPFGLVLALAGTAVAQGAGDVVYTVGTVTRDSHGRDWAYLLWQGTQPQLGNNRVFAVYSKPGDPTNPAPYTRLAVVTLQTDPRVIEPLLERSQNLGDDLTKLDQDINQLFLNIMPSGALTLADRLSAVIRGSIGNQEYYQNLLLLGRDHPGINMALGFADAELIGPGRTTFEIRAYDPVKDQDLAVIGRVTVEAGNPTVLPAPGPPVEVPETSPQGDLNLRFRWGTPDNLRRLSLLQFGYDLYRLPLDYATLHGWDAMNPPPVDVLTNLVAADPAHARLVNPAPILPSTEFTLAEAADLSSPGADTNTTFIMDDDGRGQEGYINYGFTNGAQFYYYVAARDVLGRDGVLSQGLLATVCDRMPPLPPMGVHVLNYYSYNPVSQTSTQKLEVVWNQVYQTNDVVTNYWIYRWTNQLEMNTYSGDRYNNLIAVVPHIPGASNNSYIDDGPGSPSAPGDYGKTYWYSVRAGDDGACGQNLSWSSGPAFGVLRQRAGPEAGTGYIEINCLRPDLQFIQSTLLALPGGPDTNNYDLSIHCSRTDGRFEWADFYGIAQYTPITGSPVIVSNFLGRFYYSSDAPVSVQWRPPRTNQEFRVQLEVGCRAALATGKISPYTVAAVNPPDYDFYQDVQFNAAGIDVRVIAGDTNNPDCRMHDPGTGVGGLSGTNNIIIHVLPSARSREYRIYRRVDGGPLMLLAQGGITNLAEQITAYENSPPVNGGTICFYVQLLDENGNPGPMTQLGCVDSAPVTTPPVPVLSSIKPTGDPNSPGMLLSWFCPPYGVERFEVLVAGLPSPPDTNNLELSTDLASMQSSWTPMTVTNFGTALTLPFYSFQTPRVSQAFGGGGSQFAVPCNVEIGKTYFVAVRALLKDNYPGDLSGTESFLWTPTNASASMQVPWPARGLPGINSEFTALTAAFLSPTNPPGNSPSRVSGKYTGVGVLIGSAPIEASATVDISTGPAYLSVPLDPNSAVFMDNLKQALLPCVLYRYQVPNNNFPVTSGDIIQVSPLMETIAYATNQPYYSPPTNAPVKTWYGWVNDSWDVGTTTNWTSGKGAQDVFQQGDQVVFGDSALLTTVSIQADVQPGSMLVDSVSSNYTFVGLGSISGATGLTKSGAASLTLYTTNFYSGPTFINGGSFFEDGFTVNSAVTVQSGTLGGTGYFYGPVTVQSGGTLSPGGPGAQIGKLQFNGDLTLAGNTVMEIDGTNTQFSDQAAVPGTVTYGGTLTVANLGSSPQAGDTYTLFPAGHYAGAFSGYSLPALGTNLYWGTDNLGSNGTIYVTTTPMAPLVSADTTTVQTDALSPDPGAAVAPDYSQANSSTNLFKTVIFDPFITATTSTDGSQRYLYLWLEDTQPQISGARYKYILVRFKPNHEIDELIPSSEVDVP